MQVLDRGGDDEVDRIHAGMGPEIVTSQLSGAVRQVPSTGTHSNREKS
jgi:hypothetical protein